MTAYRVVQEGLTNALRHARAQQASVAVRYLPHALEVVVEDDGRGPSANGRGLGLVGIRERVAMYDGTMHFGPGTEAGARLAVTLPVRETT